MRVKFPLVYYVLESARGVIWSRERNGTIDRGHLPSTFFQKRGLASDDAWIVDVSCEKLGGKELLVEKLLVTLAVASWDDSRSAARALGQSTPNCRGVRTSCMFRPL